MKLTPISETREDDFLKYSHFRPERADSGYEPEFGERCDRLTYPQEVQRSYSKLLRVIRMSSSVLTDIFSRLFLNTELSKLEPLEQRISSWAPFWVPHTKMASIYFVVLECNLDNSIPIRKTWNPTVRHLTNKFVIEVIDRDRNLTSYRKFRTC